MITKEWWIVLGVVGGLFALGVLAHEFYLFKEHMRMISEGFDLRGEESP